MLVTLESVALKSVALERNSLKMKFGRFTSRFDWVLFLTTLTPHLTTLPLPLDLNDLKFWVKAHLT